MLRLTKIIVLFSIIKLYPIPTSAINNDPLAEIPLPISNHNLARPLTKELLGLISNNELKLEIRSIITRLIVFNNQLEKTNNESCEQFTLDLKSAISNQIEQTDLRSEPKIMLIKESKILVDAISLFCKKTAQDLKIPQNLALKETANMLLMINIFAKTYNIIETNYITPTSEALLKKEILEQITTSARNINISQEKAIPLFKQMILIFFRTFDENTRNLFEQTFKKIEDTYQANS